MRMYVHSTCLAKQPLLLNNPVTYSLQQDCSYYHSHEEMKYSNLTSTGSKDIGLM